MRHCRSHIIRRELDCSEVVGPLANDSTAIFGTYVANPDRRFVTTPVEGLRRLSDDTRYAAGCSSPACQNYNSSSVKNTVTGAEFVVVCLGLGQHLEEEDTDRSELALPGHQLQLLKDAIYYSDEVPVLLLLFNGDPFDITFAQQSPQVGAILSCVYPAQATGEALYRTVTMTGPRSVPAARLPNTWPAQLHQIPPITNYNVSDGQTYRYLHDDPLYPFGYGLSYSRFHYSNLTVSPPVITAGQSVLVEVSVANKGPYQADEVIQVYLAWNRAALPVPRWMLVGFNRVTIPVHSSHRQQFVVTARQMSVWLNDTVGFDILQGEITVYAGGQQPHQRVNVGSNVLQAMFTVRTG